MNFFQRYRAKQSQEIEPPAVTPPPLPDEETIKAVDTIQPIHVDDAQYSLLTRALRPTSPVREDLKDAPPGPNLPAAGDGASLPSTAIPNATAPEQPSGTPIV